MIFIVDDDRSVRTSLMRLLRSAGYDAQAFANAQDCLNEISSARVTADCVILDLHMPGMNGLNLQEVINRLAPPLPVIVLTASEDLEMRARALAAGAAKVLRKPCDSTDLFQAIEEATGQSPPLSRTSAFSPIHSTPPLGEFGGRLSGLDDPDDFVLEEKHAVYRPTGCVSFDQAVALVRSAIAAARSHRVSNLLVDTTALTGFSSPNTFERFLAAVEWAQEAKMGVRLAMVALPEMIHPYKLGAIVASNRGMVSNIFPTEVEARNWLGSASQC